MKEYTLVDLAFIVGIAIILVLLNQLDKMDILTSYAIPILYACYLAGRFTVKLAKRRNQKEQIQKSTLEN